MNRNALLAASFFLYFGAGGVVMPILSLLLKQKGATGAEIGLITAAFPVAVLIAAPIAAGQVERFGHVRRFLVAGGLATLAGLLLFAFAGTWGAMIAGIVIFAFARAPLPPLLDWLTLRALGDNSDRYGAIRLWGSFAFLLTAWVFAGTLKDAVELPLLIGGGLLGLFSLGVLFLPEPPAVDQGATKGGSKRAVIAHHVLWPLLLVALAMGFADGIADVGFSLHLDRLFAGSDEVATVDIVADATAIGVASELLMLALAPLLLRRVGPMPLVLAGMAAGVIRWTVIGLATDPSVLTFVQALHGFTFAAFWTGAVAIVAEHAPLHALGSAQALLTAAMGGLGPLAASAVIAVSLGRVELDLVFLALAVVVAGATVYCGLRLRPAVAAARW